MQNKNEWEEGFQLLIEYNREFGDCLVQAKSLYCDYKLGSWVGIQRYKKDNLTSEKILRLDAVGFVWSSDQAKWEEGFRLLVAYKKEFGNCLVPTKFQYHGYELGSWVEKRRLIKDKLTTEQIHHLDFLGFMWSSNQAKWEEGFRLLVAYKKEFGNCLVPTKFQYHAFELGTWVEKWRFRQGELTPKQFSCLDDLGFIWNLSKYRWEEAFKHLAAYKDVFGDCLVGQRRYIKDISLSENQSQKDRFQIDYRLERWVDYLRRSYLTTEQVKRLNKLGMVWDPRDRQWKKFFKQLVDYKEKFGDCLVEWGPNTDHRLVRWLSKKRSQKDRLTPEQVTSLDDLGFVWDPQEAEWKAYFKHLVAHKEEFGDCLVEPIHVGSSNPYNSLAKWVSKVRSQKDSLTSKQITCLDDLGFVWDPQEAQWKTYFTQLVAHKEEFGDCVVAPIHAGLYNPHNNFAQWVSKTRSQKGSLTSDQVTSLDELGFVWDVREAHWEICFKQLLAHKEEFGDCLVWRPGRFHISLARWVRDIRRGKYRLFPDQVTRLDELGFVWDPQEAQWETHFNILVAYKEEFGDCWLEPINADLRHPYNTLAGWVYRMRSQKDRLTPEEFTRLDELGFFCRSITQL